MFFGRILITGVLVLSSVAVFASAKAEYLDQVPDTEACRVMKDDIDPNMESKENRTDIKFLYNGTMRQGRQGEQCGIFRRERSKLRSNSSLNATGGARYGKERIFAWGRLCLLDWCDMASQPSSSTPTPSTPETNDDPVIQPPPRLNPGSSSQSSPDQGVYTLELCNKSSEKIHVVLGLYDDADKGIYTIRGWWEIPSGQCKTWQRRLGRYKSHTIAAHAQSRKRTWHPANSSDINFCVRNEAFERRHEASYTCRSGEKLVGFKQMVVKAGHNRLNFIQQ